ncbi:MAG: hypothetical protein A3G93_08605 [Nitrospinae bacterium RIFCSPLOWO2_12_FULL_45_22]|nr:MAG: hypothetical protein A3G93_08605 [Nitrospinae bacterium RIFCSPLOWO2_12_FULL_45_22]
MLAKYFLDALLKDIPHYQVRYLSAGKDPAITDNVESGLAREFTTFYRPYPLDPSREYNDKQN